MKSPLAAEFLWTALIKSCTGGSWERLIRSWTWFTISQVKCSESCRFWHCRRKISWFVNSKTVFPGSWQTITIDVVYTTLNEFLYRHPSADTLLLDTCGDRSLHFAYWRQQQWGSGKIRLANNFLASCTLPTPQQNPHPNWPYTGQ